MSWPDAVVAALSILCGTGFLVALLGFFAIIATRREDQ